MIKKKIISIFSKPKPLVLVYSHPRSGTHFLEAFLAENFYYMKDLKVKNVVWGHWSNREINSKGNKYGKLFGNHFFPDQNQNNIPKIYIYRDGRAVAYSIWKTRNFINKKIEGLSFNDFLAEKIDWSGSPANQSEEKLTIFEHWAEHVTEWKRFGEKENILLVKYEDMVKNPGEQYKRIHKMFFNASKKIDDIKIINEPVGLLPNKGTIEAWRDNISTENLDLFYEILMKYKIDEYKE